ncbi:AMP-binding protein [Nostoc ellipsosporum NOK]|uniref:AMP-binding protein n=1 Tax=Sphingomonas sp. IBVSS2 TaxID=1985172 RepID=UPI000A2D3ACB|nr:AMP-binding protein [Sphingomonas sp. IBVSS2]MDF2385947.1 AMP-binding protein [Nostoc ellipsosporum NOK]OSZ62463.1 AMP-binding protein [Sphingomonas sp. IBVSS2]
MSPAASLVRGADAPPLIEHTIGAALALAAARWGEREALVSVEQDIRWTFAELLERADAFAAGLLALGLEPGERIGIWAPNCIEWTLTQFAAARAGLILVTINPAYRTSEASFTMAKVGLAALVFMDRFKTSDYAAMVAEIAPGLPALRRIFCIGAATRPGWIAFDQVAGHADDASRRMLAAIGPELRAIDAINIQFTSGTTGQPKGATLSHRNILNNGYFVGLAQRLQPGDRVCIPVPLYHCFGMVMGNLAALTHGATMVYPAAGFDPGATLAAIERERCTALYGVPTMFIAVLAHPEFERFDIGSLRTGVMAGAVCPEPLMRAVNERLHMPQVTIAYGMTETSPVSFQTAVDDPFERRIGSIGRVQPHLECKIVDEDGEVVPAGTPGELCTRGYSVMLGYWDEPEKTAAVLDAEGWMHSGDLAVIDAAGYGNVVGRLKDMVIRGGENIYPREIEEFLYGHPAVEDVAVVGVPDARMGEELCAWIRLRAGSSGDAEEVRAFCRGRIAHYKVPRYVRFVDTFPTTVTGKVQKYLIREAMIAELGLETTSQG